MPRLIAKEEFLLQALNKFQNKFVLQLPNNFLLNSEIKVVCPDHSEFSITGKAFINNKCGCPACGSKMRTVNSSATQQTPWQQRVADFNRIHDNKYIYEDNHVGNNKSKIKIQCPQHGTYEKHLFAHLAGKGCPICYTESTKTFKKSLTSKDEKAKVARINRANANKKKALNTQMPIDIAKHACYSKHGNTFEYDWESYTGWSKQMTITCKNHGSFTQSCNEHVASVHGCPSCSRLSKSKLEENWLSELMVPVRQHKIMLGSKLIKVDGYDPESNTVYEFLGDYWHGHPRWNSKLNGINQNNKKPFVELFTDTQQRFDMLRSLCYNVVYIWEHDLKTFSAKTRTFVNKLEF